MSEGPWGETSQQKWRREYWEWAWKQFEPKDGHRRPLFHVGCLTLTVAGFAGFVAAGVSPRNTGAFTGPIVFLAVMLILGFFANRRRLGITGRPVPGLFRDRFAWLCTFGGGAWMAASGARVLLDIEDATVLESAVLGGVGLVAGFVVGILVHGLRRLVRL